MKKHALAIFMLIAVMLFTTSAFADGDIGMGGRNCTGQSCPGFAPPAPGDELTDSTTTQQSDQEGSLFVEFFEYFF